MPAKTTTARLRLLLLLAVSAAALAIGTSNAAACGGFFCQTDPVDQTGERIVFTVNDDGTITSLIEILYEGSAADFSWILPIPEAIAAEDLAVPDDGSDIFRELHDLTDVQIIAPPVPECARIVMEAVDMASDDADSGVEVFASGEVGPFAFDVIGSDDPAALIDWLVQNNYRVDPPMEPLIDVYVQEEFAFIAMRLLDGETNESITPIEITYPGTEPMIPLRLTAVAALPDMPIFTWIFADTQAVPSNYAHMEIETAELTFGPFGSNDYRRLAAQRADANNGQAFLTEFAGPASSLEVRHPYLTERGDRYLTRLFSIISPEEMTVDPVFGFEDRPDVSNVRDASQLVGLYDCQRFGDDGQTASAVFTAESDEASDALDPYDGGREVVAAPVIPDPAAVVGTATDETDDAVWPWIAAVSAIAAAIAGAFVMGRSRSGRATT